MEHIKVKNMPNGMKKLTPDAGYVLVYNDEGYSEAVVSDTTGWSAREKVGG